MTDISFFESLQQHQGANVVFNVNNNASESIFSNEPMSASVSCMNAASSGNVSMLRTLLKWGIGLTAALVLSGFIVNQTTKAHIYQNLSAEQKRAIAQLQERTEKQEEVINRTRENTAELERNWGEVAAAQESQKDSHWLRNLMLLGMGTGLVGSAAGVALDPRGRQ